MPKAAVRQDTTDGFGRRCCGSTASKRAGVEARRPTSLVGRVRRYDWLCAGGMAWAVERLSDGREMLSGRTVTVPLGRACVRARAEMRD